MDISQVLDLARNWQRNHTRVNGTMMIGSREWVANFTGRVIVEGEGITITNGEGCECRIVLQPTMTFTHENEMLAIDGAHWRCNLHEATDSNFFRLV